MSLCYHISDVFFTLQPQIFKQFVGFFLVRITSGCQSVSKQLMENNTHGWQIVALNVWLCGVRTWKGAFGEKKRNTTPFNVRRKDVLVIAAQWYNRICLNSTVYMEKKQQWQKLHWLYDAHVVGFFLRQYWSLHMEENSLHCSMLDRCTCQAKSSECLRKRHSVWTIVGLFSQTITKSNEQNLIDASTYYSRLITHCDFWMLFFYYI